MKGLFIPDITVKMFRNASVESVAELMAEGRVYDIDYQEPSEDCISREDLKEPKFIIAENDYQKGWNDALNSVYENASSIQPKTGHWIFFKTVFDKYGCTVKCSSCHKRWKTYDEIRWKEENKFCPNCGEKKESEE